MGENHKDKVFSEINRLLLESELTVSESESILETVLRFHLDQLEEIEEIDLFQDKVNDLIDDYVEEHFEDTKEDNYN